MKSSHLAKDFTKDMPFLEERFGEFKNVIAKDFRRAKTKVVRTVSEHPWYYISGAAVLTALTGFLLGRKSNRH